MPPLIVLISGPPGTGKSTVAEAVAVELSASVLAWDWAMAALTQFTEVQRTLEMLDRPTHRRVGWSILWNMATAQVRAGRSVVLDGVARPGEIEATRALASDLGTGCLVVMTWCSDAVEHRRRVEARRREIPGWHELDWAHVVDFVGRWDEPDDVDVRLDAADPLSQNVSEVNAAISAMRA